MIEEFAAPPLCKDTGTHAAVVILEAGTLTAQLFGAKGDGNADDTVPIRRLIYELINLCAFKRIFQRRARIVQWPRHSRFAWICPCNGEGEA